MPPKGRLVARVNEERKRKHAERMRRYRACMNEKQRSQQAEYMRNYRARRSMSEEQRSQQAEYMRNYRACKSMREEQRFQIRENNSQRQRTARENMNQNRRYQIPDTAARRHRTIRRNMTDPQIFQNRNNALQGMRNLELSCNLRVAVQATNHRPKSMQMEGESTDQTFVKLESNEEIKTDVLLELTTFEDIKPDFSTFPTSATSTILKFKEEVSPDFHCSDPEIYNDLAEINSMYEISMHTSMNEISRDNLSLNSPLTTTEEKIDPCVMCDEKFQSIDHINQHLKIHVGVNLFQFARSQHNRIYVIDEPLECYNCHEKFSQKSDLARFKRTHSGDKVYECEFCYKKLQMASLSNYLSNFGKKKRI